MPKVAWAKKLYNAYNHIKKGDKVYDYNNNLIGTADGWRLRATDKHPGTVFLEDKKSISGDVEKTEDGWKIVKLFNPDTKEKSNPKQNQNQNQKDKNKSKVKIEPQCLVMEIS